jgi:hypothetical protein
VGSTIYAAAPPFPVAGTGRWWSARSWPPSSWRPIPQSADSHADTDHRRAGRHDRGSHADIRGRAILPLTGRPPLSRYAGTTVQARVRVQLVAANEGFWVGTSVRDRVWVQLIGTRESGFRVEPGDKVAHSPGGWSKTQSSSLNEPA